MNQVNELRPPLGACCLPRARPECPAEGAQCQGLARPAAADQGLELPSVASTWWLPEAGLFLAEQGGDALGGLVGAALSSGEHSPGCSEQAAPKQLVWLPRHSASAHFPLPGSGPRKVLMSCSVWHYNRLAISKNLLFKTPRGAE